MFGGWERRMSNPNVYRGEFSRRISQIMNMVADGGLTRFEVLMLVARLTCVTAIGFFSMKWIMSQLDPTNSSKKRAKKKVLSRFVQSSWRNFTIAYYFLFACKALLIRCNARGVEVVGNIRTYYGNNVCFRLVNNYVNWLRQTVTRGRSIWSSWQITK